MAINYIKATAPTTGGCIGTAGVWSTGFSGDTNQDYWTLPTGKVNKFNHNYRWCGITGGYTDGSAYYDVSGLVTTQVLAFPETIVCDLGNVNCDGDFTMYQYDYQYTVNITYADALTACTSFTTTSFVSGWRMGSIKELFELFYQPNAHSLEQRPFESLGPFYTQWSVDEQSSNTANAFTFTTTMQISASAKSGAAGRAFPVRTGNVSEI